MPTHEKSLKTFRFLIFSFDIYIYKEKVVVSEQIVMSREERVIRSSGREFGPLGDLTDRIEEFLERF